MKARSPAQEAAAMRNWGIRQLRALHAQCHMLAPERRSRAWAVIDEELAARGAETEYERETKRLLMAALADDGTVFEEVAP